jgi:hypothetical protein
LARSAGPYPPPGPLPNAAATAIGCAPGASFGAGVSFTAKQAFWPGAGELQTRRATAYLTVARLLGAALTGTAVASPATNTAVAAHDKGHFFTGAPEI